MKKMNIHRKKIHNKKMICPADKKCCFFGPGVEGKKNVKVKKRPKDTDGKKKEVCPGPGTFENRQSTK